MRKKAKSSRKKRRQGKNPESKRSRWKRWTRAEELKLLASTSEASATTLRRLAGRGEGAIRQKARRMWGSGSLTRGTLSLRDVIKSTGYNWRQLRRAQLALRQRWCRLRRGGRYMISEAQVEEILGWLKLDYWSRPTRAYACGWCGTSQEPHRALGLCRRCYGRYRVALKALDLTEVGQEGLSDLVRAYLRPRADPLRSALTDLRRGAAMQRRHLIELAVRIRMVPMTSRSST
jgi:hypothetical protein